MPGGFPNAFGSKKVKNTSDLKDTTMTRLVTADEVAEAAMESLRLDRTGACYVIFPDAPLIEMPHMGNGIFVFAAFLARVFGALLGVKVFRSYLFYIFAVWFLLVLFYLVSCLFSFLF